MQTSVSVNGPLLKLQLLTIVKLQTNLPYLHSQGIFRPLEPALLSCAPKRAPCVSNDPSTLSYTCAGGSIWRSKSYLCGRHILSLRDNQCILYLPPAIHPPSIPLAPVPFLHQGRMVYLCPLSLSYILCPVYLCPVSDSIS